MKVIDIRSWEQIVAIVENELPESPSVEYKSALNIKTLKQRLEVLKDLTGMGNSGGGTVIFGVAEDPQREGVPLVTETLVDRRVVGVLEDIVRSGVRPPLLLDLRLIDGDRGFVLVAEVMRSPLGPYMVEGYGDARYYSRHGTRTIPMTEQEVRDAYLLASRSADQREAVWQRHLLPMRPETEVPWLTVSAIPEEPLVDVFDPVVVPLGAIQFPAEMTLQANVGRFSEAASTGFLALWADGAYGIDAEVRPSAAFRLHRDGAAAIGCSLFQGNINIFVVARQLNAQLIYLAWLWKRLTLRSSIEIRVQLNNLEMASVEVDRFGLEERKARQPVGVPVPMVSLTRRLLPWQLSRAHVRHTFVRDFADRTEQAFGFPQAKPLFRVGWLYGRDGRPLELSIGGRGIWNIDGEQRAYLYASGQIRNYYRDGLVVGYLTDGVIVDAEGMALATLEMAPGVGLPDDFVQRALTDSVIYNVRGGDPGQALADSDEVAVPMPIAEWSEQSLKNLLEP